MTVRLSWESSLGAVQMSGVIAAPGEAPPVISAHVEQWAAHPLLTRRVKVQHPAQVY